MINTNRGKVEMNGSAYELLADLSVIVNTLCYNILIEQCGDTPDDAKRMIMECVERGLKTDEEIEREHEDMHASAKDELLGMLGDLTELLRKAVEK